MTPSTFPTPGPSNPNAFLSGDSASIVLNEHFIPYGMGKRMCMGVPLAKAELFLFFAIIVQTLSVSMPKEHKAPEEDEAKAGVTRSPKPFHVHVATR